MPRKRKRKARKTGVCFDKKNRFVKCSSPRAVRPVPKRRRRRKR